MEEGSIIFVVCLIGIISSGFSLFTLTITLLDTTIRSRPSTVPIASFLVASVLLGLLALPMYLYRKLSDNHSVLGICDLYRVPYFFCGHIMTMSLFYVSLDRLFVIIKPFKYRDTVTTSKFKLLVITSWVVTAIIDALPFKFHSRSTDGCVYTPTKDWGVGVIIIYIIVPLITIVTSYSLIWVKAVKIAMEEERLRVNTTPADNNSHKHHHHSIVELKATKTTIVLIVTYILCWGPLGIFYMVDQFCDNCYSSNERLSVFRTTIKILALASSFIAPVVYCWWNKEFRKATCKIFQKYKSKIEL